MPNLNTKLEWKDAAANGIEVELLDDDFSDSVDGSGFVLDIPFIFNPRASK